MSRKTIYPVETVDVSSLTPHPKNYQTHPPDQMRHLVASIKEHGFYRNVVIAKDSTILAGHGVVEASKKLKLKSIPVIRMNVKFDDPAAIKVLAGDNEISNLADVDDKSLMELLNTLNDVSDLLGTGYDEDALNGLLQKADPNSFVADQWVGMPEFESEDIKPFRQVLMSFKCQEDVDAFASLLSQSINDSTRSVWYPEVKAENTKDTVYVVEDEST
jgi:hypothetical protein